MHWDQAHENPGEFVVGRLDVPQSRSPYLLAAAAATGCARHGVDGRLPGSRRTFARILSRLTKIDVRVVEQPVNLDDGSTRSTGRS